MGLYRKLARSKKGMSTIFGGLFFIILILMGFNLMLWGFIQMDAYNSVLASMNQRDQQAISENLVPANPGAINITASSFNILVNNLGGTSVSISRIYIFNISPTGSSTCSGAAAPCLVDPAPSGTGYSFINGNVPAGQINYKISVNGLGSSGGPGDGSGYKVILASTRGRLYTFFYPWPQALPSTGGGGGQFVTNIGPLSIFFDYRSFNFTQGSQTISQTAYCTPSSVPIVFWIKVANSATDSSVTIKANTMMQMQPYSANGFGQFVRIWVDDNSTVNPSNVVAYDEVNKPYVLPPAGVNGPSGFTIIKFSASGQSGTGAPTMGRDDNWIIFIGFYYKYRGLTQGQTIPFVDLKSTGGYPATC